MKTTTVLEELEQAAAQLGFVVRKEKGNFRGGICTVDGEAIIMLNKRHISDVQLVVLADSLRSAPIDTIYLKPAVRNALQEAWDQLDAREAARAEADLETSTEKTSTKKTSTKKTSTKKTSTKKTSTKKTSTEETKNADSAAAETQEVPYAR